MGTVSLKLTLSVINATCVTMRVTFVAFLPSVSFGMAYDFIDSVGNDVDVVSDSEVSVLMHALCRTLKN